MACYRLKFKYLLPAFLWFVVITIVVLTPGSSLPKSKLFDIPFLDKLIHLVLFFIFGVLLYFGFHKQSDANILKRMILTFTIVIGLAYSIITEVLQHYIAVGRSGDFVDLAANVAGFLGGVFFIRQIIRHFNS